MPGGVFAPGIRPYCGGEGREVAPGTRIASFPLLRPSAGLRGAEPGRQPPGTLPAPAPPGTPAGTAVNFCPGSLLPPSALWDDGAASSFRPACGRCSPAFVRAPSGLSARRRQRASSRGKGLAGPCPRLCAPGGNAWPRLRHAGATLSAPLQKQTKKYIRICLCINVK